MPWFSLPGGRPVQVPRRLLTSVMDMAGFTLCGLLAFQLRFDGSVPAIYAQGMREAIVIWAVAKSAAFFFGAVNAGYWRYTSLDEAVRIALANSVGSMAGGAIIFLAVHPGIPRSVYILEWLTSGSFTLGTRFAVRLAGQPCDMDRIQQLAASHSLHVIEDAAHSLPASFRGTPVGAISPLTAFSFYATKTLTTGEGGMVTTDDDELAARMKMMRLHGIGRDAWKRYSSEGSWYYEVLNAGFKYNLTDIQSAIGIVQLSKCTEMRSLRAQIARQYTEAFSQCEQIETPTVLIDRESAWHLYVLRLHLDRLTIGRSEFVELLKQRGVGTSVHFIPLHMHPYYRDAYHYCHESFPVALREYHRSISLPIYPGMSTNQVAYVIEQVSEVVKESIR